MVEYVPKNLISKAAPALERLDRHVRSVQNKSGSGYKRASMTPSYNKWRVQGTRPKSDRGVTFHFKHSFITKGRHMSQSAEDQTPAAKYQAYIERPGAVEQPDSWEPILGEPTPLNIKTEEKAKTKTGMSAQYSSIKSPEPILIEERLSFGTLGKKRKERCGFWRLVEQNEGRKGRVQCRTILELPCEVNSDIRFRIARDFCRIFEERSLPYWCAIHAPSGNNDDRNYHLHIVYYDRPSRQTDGGKWDFALEEKVKGKNRTTRITHPWRQDKDRDAQGRAWITILRRRYADIANFHLAIAGKDKRYDPRPYRESGIIKEPTTHLGTNVAVAEYYGVATYTGDQNTKKEIQYRLGRVDHEEMHLAEMRQNVTASLLDAADKHPTEKILNQAFTYINIHAQEAEKRAESIRQAEAHRIAAEAATIRMNQRLRFTQKEADRLAKRAQPEAIAAVARLKQEQEIVIQEAPNLSALAHAWEQKAKTSLEAAAISEKNARAALEEASKLNQQLKEVKTIPQNAEERALAALLGKAPEVRKTAQLIPGTISVVANIDKSEHERIMEDIRRLNNRDLRMQALSTRDAADLHDDENQRQAYKRGFVLFQEVAKERGLSLETGLLIPKRATVPQAAIEHPEHALNEEETRRLRDLGFDFEKSSRQR